MPTAVPGADFALFPHPGRLRAAALLGAAYRRAGGHAVLARAGVLDRLPARLRAAESLLPPARLAEVTRRQPGLVRAKGRRKLQVGMLTGCVQRRVLLRGQRGHGPGPDRGGLRRGGPALTALLRRAQQHAGREPEALARARALIDAFADTDVDVSW